MKLEQVLERFAEGLVPPIAPNAAWKPPMPAKRSMKVKDMVRTIGLTSDKLEER